MQEPDAAAVADALSRVYARPEFQDRARTGLLQTVADLWSAFTRWLGSLVGAAFEAVGGAGPWLGDLLVGLLVVAAAGAAAYLLARVLRRTAPPPAQEGTVGAGAVPLDAEGWEAAARRARAEGRLRDAALALYRAALLRLDARGAVRFHEGKTPGDYRREVRSDPGLAPSFERFVRILLPLAFAAGAPDAREYEALREVATGMGVDA